MQNRKGAHARTKKQQFLFSILFIHKFEYQLSAATRRKERKCIDEIAVFFLSLPTSDNTIVVFILIYLSIPNENIFVKKIPTDIT